MNKTLFLIPKKLDWDSDFFHFKIGEIRILNKDVFDSENFVIDCLNFDLLYIFVDENSFIKTKNYNLGNLVDIRTIFECEIDKDMTFEGYPEIKECNEKNQEIINLALLSGHKSRFRIDPNFKISDFEKLYTEWIIKSLEGQIADKVWGYYREDKLAGFITLKIQDSLAKIGLVAVDPKYGRQGIGSKLIKTAKYYASEMGIDKLQVVTQENNWEACNLYSKNEFYIIDKTYIYHKWLNK